MKNKVKFSIVAGIGLMSIYALKPCHKSDFHILYNQDLVNARLEYLKTKKPPTKRTISSPPNIILILADDLGKTDISTYGSELIKTPNIDKIANEGVKFTEGYITSPICAPSRAGLITGRYQQRFGFEHIIHERYPKNKLEYWYFKTFMKTGDWQVREEFVKPCQEDIFKQGLPPSEITLSEILQKNGYKTACIGKWHLGYNESAIPINRGFDYQYGFYEAFTLYSDPKDDSIINQKHDYFADQHIWKQGRKGNCAIRRNHHAIHEDQFLTEKLANEAVDFINKNKDYPFFLYVPFLTPHTPFQITKKYFDQFDHIEDRNKRVYLAMIKSLDDAIGQILDGVEDNNLSNETCIIFLSDNGGATYTKATDNAPLKGGKFTNFEGGLNVPFIIKFPNDQVSSRVYQKPVSSLDIMPTILALSGIKAPEDRNYDGVNLIPFITDSTAKNPHPNLYWKSGYNMAIRQDNWKLVIDNKSKSKALYNLKVDKSEINNLIQANSLKAEELESQLDEWKKDLKDPFWPYVMDYKYELAGDTFYFPL